MKGDGFQSEKPRHARSACARLCFGPVIYFLVVAAQVDAAGEKVVAETGKTRIQPAVRTLPMAPLGPSSRWPRFRFQMPAKPIATPADLAAEDRAGMFTNAVVPPLPYLMQENYTRDRRMGQIPTIEVESPLLKAIFYPSLGGRMISLYDKRERRELLFDNPVLQFANLAIRNAWFSGGVEWNGPLYGHSLLTCSPVFAGVVETSRGPMLRIYEFDRALETTWQVDIFAGADDRRLWVHVRAINPNAGEVPFYWWTNIAVPMTEKTRVICPFDYALSHDFSGNSRIEFPCFDGFDGSHPFLYPYFKSVFFRKPLSEKPWSVAIDGGGLGLSHVSTPTLFGRKFFTWGTGRGGRRWMEFLSDPGKGDYIEIQGGVTPTQLQTRPLPAGGTIEWTECMGAFAMDPSVGQGADYDAARAAAGKMIDESVPGGDLRAMDTFLREHAAAPMGRLLFVGAGWGRLYEQRTGRRISPGLEFEAAVGDEERPWAELLDDGTFSAGTLEREPASFNVSAGWIGVLRESMRRHGTTWLHHAHLGVALLDAGSFEEARNEFSASLTLRESALARRCAALLAERDGDLDAAYEAYQRAWRGCGNDANLAVEICGFLVRHGRHSAFDAFVRSLPPSVAAHERIALAEAQIALERGDHASVRLKLDREYAMVREGEVSLTDLWFASHVREQERHFGKQLAEDEIKRLIEANPPPRQIDFRMK